MVTPDFSVLDHIPDVIIVVNKEDHVVFLNRQAVQARHMFYSVATPGAPFVDIVPPEDRPVVHETLQQIKAQQRPMTLEVEYRDAKGGPVSIEVTYNPMANDGGTLEWIYVLMREISDERIFKKWASRLAQDLSTLIENANAVIFGVDSSRYLTEWNKECARITGLEKEDVLAKKVDTVIEVDANEGFNDYLKRIFDRHPTHNFKLRMRTANGNPVIVLLNATPRVNNTGSLIGILFVGHDITELDSYRLSLEKMVKDNTRELEMSLEKEKELVAIRNKFVSMASHEFRIPLSNIISSTQFIKVNASLNAEAMAKVTRIETQVGHMRLLIDDVLAMGKGDAHTLKAKIQRLDLILLIRQIADEVIVSAQHSHEIRVTAPTERIEIDSDEKLLRNIFVNLLSNAVKFSPGKPAVFLTIDKMDPWIEISVADEGIGIEESERNSVFEPFSRGSNVSEIKGTGLGLSIVKRAVETLGGTIALEPGRQRGTTFRVKLRNGMHKIR